MAIFGWELQGARSRATARAVLRSWIGLWAVWYGTQRAFLDTLRFGMGDSTIGVFTWNQIGGALLAFLGLIFFLKNKNIKKD